MCLTPITIKNPSYCRSSYASEFGSLVEVSKNLVPSTEYITVPCGKCDDCRNIYFNSLLQRSLVEGMFSYMYFVTLTYDNDHIPSLTLPSGKVVFYSDYSDIQNMFKRFRRAEVLDRDFRYICVNEYGDSYNRPHNHLLIFVSKKDTDTRVTPHEIERILFDNLGKYFAINTGTLKNPVYECLFTHRTRYVNGRLFTNYFVKYVEPSIDYYYWSNNQDTTYVKTIQYLIGYVNKSSSFDNEISDMLDALPKYDPILPKLKQILRSRVRFSKGLGCGFDNGTKLYLPKISCRISSCKFIFTEIANSLPNCFSEFAEAYPEQLDNLVEFINYFKYEKYKSFDDALRHFTYDDLFNHFVLLRYFPKFLTWIADRYYRESKCVPTISYFFNRQHTEYSFPYVRTNDVVRNPVFDFIRAGVEAGINSAVPFIAFPMLGTQKYTSLCKYYRDRCTTFSDIGRMFRAVRVRNYEQWQQLFTNQLSTYKTNKSNGNKLKYAKNAEKICNIQKHCLISKRDRSGSEFYRYLLSDCK